MQRGRQGAGVEKESAFPSERLGRSAFGIERKQVEQTRSRLLNLFEECFSIAGARQAQRGFIERQQVRCFKRWKLLQSIQRGRSQGRGRYQMLQPASRDVKRSKLLPRDRRLSIGLRGWHGLHHEPVERLVDCRELFGRPGSESHLRGLVVANDHSEEFFNYFLDHSHHAPHARLDAISYHFYALEKKDESLGEKAASFSAQADHFLETVKKIESTRKRLSPATETQINETGCIAATDQFEGPEKMSGTGIVPSYWSLCGAMFSYVAGKLGEMGIEVVGASQLVGHPSQFPSVSLVDWTTGRPNARYDSLKLLIDNLAPGDRFANSSVDDPRLYVLPIIARNGQRKIMLVNKTSDDVEVNIANETAQKEVHADATAPGLQTNSNLISSHITLHAFAVMCVTLPPEAR